MKYLLGLLLGLLGVTALLGGYFAVMYVRERAKVGFQWA